MAGITNYLEQKFLEHLVGIANLPTAPTTLYLGVNSADDDTGGSEVTSTYFSGRASFATSIFGLPATVGGQRQIVATSQITFSAASTGGSVGFYSIWDAATSGNCLVVDKFVNNLGVDTALDFGAGDTPSVIANTIKIGLSLSGYTTYLRNLQLNWFRGTTAASAVAPYLGLATAAASDGSSTEVTSTIRVAGRLQVSAWDAIAQASGRAFTRNTNAINFGNSAGTVSGVAYLPFWDDATSGNMLIYPSLSTTRNVATGDPVIWQANTCRLEQG